MRDCSNGDVQCLLGSKDSVFSTFQITWSYKFGGLNSKGGSD